MMSRFGNIFMYTILSSLHKMLLIIELVNSISMDGLDMPIHVYVLHYKIRINSDLIAF